MGVGTVSRTEYDQHVRNAESVMKQISNNLEDLKVESRQSNAETKRIVEELHDQVYGMSQEIARLPLQLEKGIMAAIDSKYTLQKDFELVKRIAFGFIIIVLGFAGTIITKVIYEALSNGAVKF